jgi:hypothetical protein
MSDHSHTFWDEPQPATVIHGNNFVPDTRGGFDRYITRAHNRTECIPGPRARPA